ncbi:MAG: hypothetical protein R3D67_09380 [Hyphomicrobiaceae bacterium]
MRFYSPGLWYQRQNPRRILSYGSQSVASRLNPGAPVTLKTRTVAIGPRQIQEIELPNGTWIDCAGNCAKAAREAGPEFWDTLNRNTGR